MRPLAAALPHLLRRCRLAGLAALAATLCTGAAGAAGLHTYPGAIHIHTVYSDGSGTVEEVVKAAREAALSFIILSDHNTLEPLEKGYEGYHDGVMVLAGVEISTDSGHCLTLDVPAGFDWGGAAPQTVIDRINAAGGIAILAHPVSVRWQWQDWSVRGYHGMEIINLASLVDDDIRSAAHNMPVDPAAVRRLGQLTKRYLADPKAVMTTITNNTVDPERARWDELLRSGRRVVGIASVDAHARVPVGGQEFRVPTYREAFDSVQTYVVSRTPLTGDFARDRRIVYDAIREGRVYMVYPLMAPAPGFRFSAVEGDAQAIGGETLRLRRAAKIVVEAPDHRRPLIRLLKDGEEVASAQGPRLEWECRSPGVYRAEVYVRRSSGPLVDIRRGLRLPSVSELLRSRSRDIRPWIFSNPIYVRS